MKREYMKPKMHVVKIQHSGIICTSPGGSGWGVIGPDEPDAPAGARGYRGVIGPDEPDTPGGGSGYRGGIDWDDWDE